MEFKNLSPFGKSRISVFLIIFIALFFSLFNCSTENQPETVELPSDEETMQIIETELEKASDVPESEIEVNSKDGVVTLTGSVPSLLAKQSAGKISSSVHGVISVVNNIKVTVSREDEAIEEDLKSSIATNPVTESWQVSPSVQNGFVTLTGTVDSWQERQLVEKLASSIKGVTEVQNNIVITEPANVSPDEISAEIKRSLIFDSRIADNMISVSVDDNTARLSGTVGSLEEKNLAVNRAYVAGVDSVVADRLEVHPEYERSIFQNEAVEVLQPSQIEEALNSAFKYDPRVPADQIDVNVEENTAVLTGTVENLNAKLAAEDDARNTAGIHSVTNNISVERKVVVTPKVPTTDEAIKKRIRESIARDPYVNDTSLSIDVAEGFVNLEGEVDSEFKEEQIEDIVGNVKGVIAIENQITVVNKSSATS